MKRFFTTILFCVFAINANATDMDLPIRGVADGDTIKSTLKIPCPLCMISVRIRGIDTPESNFLAKCAKEKQLGLQAKDFLISITKGHDEMKVKDVKWDKYGGRIDGTIVINDIDIGQEMIRLGLAKPYTGKGPKPNWCK